ncbi:c-type cytochrome [Luteimonas sp. e5]
MNIRMHPVAAALALLLLVGCQKSGSDAPAPAPDTASQATTTADSTDEGDWKPPSEDSIPDDRFGEMVRMGRDIFMDTPKHAAKWIGNDLSCQNCHLDAGRMANSAPLWGAYNLYPQYRQKIDGVDDFISRIQGCFIYSMNGTMPPADAPELRAIATYAYWLSQGVPLGTRMPGAGYPKAEIKAAEPADYARGEQVYTEYCAVCHGADGEGQRAGGRQVFPALWGSNSYNWGAGMHQLDNASAFIKYNMPLGLGGTLSDQQALDVALYINAHERPQDPRFTGDVAETRKRFHDTDASPYGTVVNGHLLGSKPAPSRPRR